jgi:hypothetical protein
MGASLRSNTAELAKRFSRVSLQRCQKLFENKALLSGIGQTELGQHDFYPKDAPGIFLAF